MNSHFYEPTRALASLARAEGLGNPKFCKCYREPIAVDILVCRALPLLHVGAVFAFPFSPRKWSPRAPPPASR